ncbi:hypothetical protein Hypma_010811 [Hypsizygus marmoreus]|uniref:Uncharacterized protein n=1 Tax=Hypsizygus marmoreus TaxID=39966 RepID=A0A369JJJ3_HYPMA|nr:hypothetical protein Hypma_010811 [Hypsizygus marmoreus]
MYIPLYGHRLSQDLHFQQDLHQNPIRICTPLAQIEQEKTRVSPQGKCALIIGCKTKEKGGISSALPLLTTSTRLHIKTPVTLSLALRATFNYLNLSFAEHALFLGYWRYLGYNPHTFAYLSKTCPSLTVAQKASGKYHLRIIESQCTAQKVWRAATSARPPEERHASGARGSLSDATASETAFVGSPSSSQRLSAFRVGATPLGFRVHTRASRPESAKEQGDAIVRRAASAHVVRNPGEHVAPRVPPLDRWRVFVMFISGFFLLCSLTLKPFFFDLVTGHQLLKGVLAHRDNVSPILRLLPSIPTRTTKPHVFPFYLHFHSEPTQLYNTPSIAALPTHIPSH